MARDLFREGQRFEKFANTHGGQTYSVQEVFVDGNLVSIDTLTIDVGDLFIRVHGTLTGHRSRRGDALDACFYQDTGSVEEHRLNSWQIVLEDQSTRAQVHYLTFKILTN